MLVLRRVSSRTARLTCGAAILYHTMVAVGMRYRVLPRNQPAAMADEILTVAEVAHLLKVASKTVYTMAQNAELPCFKVRGQWRFRRQDLDSWMASQVVGATSGAPAPKKKTGGRAGTLRAAASEQSGRASAGSRRGGPEPGLRDRAARVTDHKSVNEIRRRRDR